MSELITHSAHSALNCFMQIQKLHELLEIALEQIGADSERELPRMELLLNTYLVMVEAEMEELESLLNTISQQACRCEGD